MKEIKVGLIGLGCRGSGLIHPILACENVSIVALCDIYEDRRENTAAEVEKISGKRPVLYEDHRELLKDENVDAVVIATPWREHIRMAIDAMREGIATAMEVGGAYSIGECEELVRTYEETKTPFMMLENCCFDRFELLSTSLVRNGRLGEIVHCHGAYAHDLRTEVLGGRVNRHYRLDEYRTRNRENYPTHELGPIAKLLHINRGNRLVSLVSVASKPCGLAAFAETDKNPDKSQMGVSFSQGDVVSTILTCEGGETITLTLDTTLPRYYSREFTVRGTKGLCNGEADMVLIEDDDNLEEYFETGKTIAKHHQNTDKYKEYLPEIWRNVTEEQLALGHGGMDFFEFAAFFRALRAGDEMPVDVYDAATWMAVSALSEASIAQGGMPQAFPDFTSGAWKTRPHRDVIDLPTVPKN